MDLELLLARADNQRPALETGVPFDAVLNQPHPGKLGDESHLEDRGGDPNHLPAQRWGIVVPQGERGKRLLALIEPLRKARQEAQGGKPVKVYEVESRMDAVKALAWKAKVFRNEAVAASDLPRYLLFLGDLNEVSLELQQIMASDCFPGRLTFPTDAGYEGYVSKVLRWEKEPSTEAQARSLFYTARDNTRATSTGYQVLVKPGLDLCRRNLELGEYPVQELAEVGSERDWSLDRLLEQAAARKPGVLFTLSHGLGAPLDGWKTPALQRELQGAMSLGGGRRLTAADLAGKPFMPGGFWFFFACFSAGTPVRSAYYPWLHHLKEAGQYSGSLKDVVDGLPRAGEPPFIAALPQAALASPDGPLAVIGHVDLAWSYSFLDGSGGSRASRFVCALQNLVLGRRAGVGLGALMGFATEADVELSTLYGREEDAKVAGLPPPPEPLHRARVWMQRHDLASFMLLGDPAVRLPLAGTAPVQVTVHT